MQLPLPANIILDPEPFLMVPTKISISDYVGMMKGRTAISVFNRFKKLKSKTYWGNSFWA
jgi:putative transposase